MAEKREFDSFVVQFAPYAARTDHVSIGVAVFDRSRTSEFAEIRFVKDWRTVQCMRPDVDVECLDALKRELTARFTAAADREQLIKALESSCSNGIRLSAAMPMLTDDPAAELGVMERQYLRVDRPRRPEAGARAKIVWQMQSAFAAAGVWDAMWHDLAVADYTYKGDPLKIDCGYRPNGVVKMFQAVSLPNGVNAVKSLAFSWPQLAEGIWAKAGAAASLTAVIPDGSPRSDEAVAFALDVLQRSKIAVAEVATLSHIAMTVREELGLKEPS